MMDEARAREILGSCITSVGDEPVKLADVIRAIQAAVDEAVAVERERIERLDRALTAIMEGDVPRAVGKVYRRDGVSSKHDRCTHDEWMYNDCGTCIAEFAATAIR